MPLCYVALVQFRRFPFKFVINVALVWLTTHVIFDVNANAAGYTRTSFDTWDYLLAPQTARLSYAAGPPKVYYLYDTTDLLATLNQNIASYYSLNASIDHYQFTLGADGRPVSPQLTVNLFAAGEALFDLTVPYDTRLVSTTYAVSPGNLGPWVTAAGSNGTTIPAATLRALSSLTLSWGVDNYDLTTAVRVCYHWTVTVTYAFATRSRIDMTIVPTYALCDAEVWPGGSGACGSPRPLPPRQPTFVLPFLFLASFSFDSYLLFNFFLTFFLKICCQVHTAWYKRTTGNQMYWSLAVLILSVTSQLLYIKAIYRQVGI